MKDVAPRIKLKFVVNPNYDILGYEQIVAHAASDIKPDNLLKTKDEITIKVKEQFLADALLIKKRLLEIELAWKILEKSFYQIALKIFDSKDFPRHIYECYPTICPLISRDPRLHRIAFPYKVSNTEACYVIAHEILHELFFFHIDRVFGNEIDINSRTIWDLSEITNVLIMREQEWQTIFHLHARPYSVHEKLLLSLEPVWKKSKNLDEFLRSSGLLKSNI